MSAIQKISFGSYPPSPQNKEAKHRRERSFLEDVSRMTDEEIINASFKKANEKTENSATARVLKNGPSLIYAATSITYGALKKGSLSTKAASAIGAMALFGILSAASKPIDKGVDKVMNIGAKENLDRKAEHPVAATALSLAGLAGVAYAAVKGGKKGADTLAKKFQPAANELGQHIQKTAKKIDGSKLGELTDMASKSAAEFAGKHPKISSFVKAVAPWAPAITGVAASVPLGVKALNERDSLAIDNMVKLAACRELADNQLKQQVDVEA